MQYNKRRSQTRISGESSEEVIGCWEKSMNLFVLHTEPSYNNTQQIFLVEINIIKMVIECYHQTQNTTL